MNFLSNTVKIGNQRSTNDETKVAVEKIFLYITTDIRDCFIESIKQITVDDLKYFSSTDVISPEIRDTCDDFGYTFRTLLEFIGMGCFNKTDMKMIRNMTNHKNYDKYLSSYISKEATLQDIVKSICTSMSDRFKEEDFRVAIVKESVPLMILALADYITEYFDDSKERKWLVKDLFKTLYNICTGNNNCKGQIFKGDGLRHLTKLIDRENNACFFFLNRICDSDDNIAIFWGRGFFSEIIRVYKKFQVEILADYKFAADDLKKIGEGGLNKPVNKNIDVDDWVLYIILNNLFSKLMNKKFINETAKLQSSLEIQEALYPSLSTILLPNMMSILGNNKGKDQEES